MIPFRTSQVLPKDLSTPHAFCTFFFLSLVAPSSIANFRFFFEKINFSQKKLVLKQSYVLLTWFYYLTIFKPCSSKRNVRLFVAPIKRDVLTMSRAPIAHKNNSKEQFMFQYYLLRVSFRSHMTLPITSWNQSIIFFFLTKKNFPIFETNLLFLKSYKFKVPLRVTSEILYS